MEKTEHTPGPWEIEVEDDKFFILDSRVGNIVCRVEPWTTEVDMADARLIAAAPDMLLALILARAELEATVARNAVDAAIARATGAA